MIVLTQSVFAKAGAPIASLQECPLTSINLTTDSPVSLVTGGNAAALHGEDEQP
jgi:hypothetical protein